MGQHQEDLAEGVSYLGSAVKGFQSIAYSGSSPVPWGNIFVNPASLSNTFGVIGPCGAFDEVLNQVLGPDPRRATTRPARCPARDRTPAPGRAPSSSSLRPRVDDVHPRPGLRVVRSSPSAGAA